MAADFTIKSGDTLPVLTDTLTYSNGEAVNLTGASLTLTMRKQTAARAVTLTGTARIVAATKGEVSFTFSAADTATVGEYGASWRVTFSGGETMSFPTSGYLSISVEPSLSTEGGQTLVPLPEVKEYLNIQAQDRTQDAKLLRFIEAVAPLIETHVGPIRVKTFREKHEGGRVTITLRHPPSVGFGTTPVLNLLAVAEYRGPIEYPLAVVATPSQGSVYSVQLDETKGVIIRRTSGGGTEPFFHDPERPGSNIHVVYQSGQEEVPQNVQEAALEAIRVNYQTTQPTGRGRLTVADTEEVGPYMGFFLPRRAIELLTPNKRHPAIA